MSGCYCYHFDLELQAPTRSLGASLEFLLSDLIDLDSAYFPHPWSSESWRQLASAPARSERIFACLVDSDRQIAAAGVYLVNSADSFSHLIKIWVMPAFRRQGLGEFLLQSMEVTLKRCGIGHFFLEVESSNAAAISLYEKAGYQKIHFKRDFYGTGRDADIMERRTSPAVDNGLLSSD